jgi:hypothetical protein
MALIDDFKARFPEFTDAVVDQHIPILENVWPCYFAKPYTGCNTEAILNLVAHLLTTETQTSSASAKNVASKSVGSVSTSYVQASQSTRAMYDMFGTTKYGQRFLQLIAHKGGACAV